MEPTFNQDYEDRGMMKWGGFILAEHQQSADESLAQQQLLHPPKAQMTTEEISSVLSTAQRKNLPVSIQLEALNEQHHYYPDIIGEIAGYDELGLYICEQKIDYDEIRHVSLAKVTKWSDLS